MAGDASLGITPVMKWNFERSCYRWLVTRHPAQFERLDFTAQILQSASRARKAFYECGWAEAKVLIRPSDGKFERTPFFDAIIRRGLRNSTRFDASTLTEDEIEALGMHRDETLGFKLQIRHFRSNRKELPPQGRGGGGVRKQQQQQQQQQSQQPPQAHRGLPGAAMVGARSLSSSHLGAASARAPVGSSVEQQQQQPQWGTEAAAVAAAAAAAAARSSGDPRWADEARWHRTSGGHGGGDRWTAWDANRWMPGSEGASPKVGDRDHRYSNNNNGHLSATPLGRGLTHASSPSAASPVVSAARHGAWDGVPQAGGVWGGGPQDRRPAGSSSWHLSAAGVDGRGDAAFERSVRNDVEREGFGGGGGVRAPPSQPEGDVRAGGGGGFHFHPSVAVEQQQGQQHPGPTSRASPGPVSGTANGTTNSSSSNNNNGSFRHGAVGIDAPARDGSPDSSSAGAAGSSSLISQGYRRLAAMADERAAAAAAAAASSRGGVGVGLTSRRLGGAPTAAAVLDYHARHHSPVRQPLPHEYDDVPQPTPPVVVAAADHKRTAASMNGGNGGARDGGGEAAGFEHGGQFPQQRSQQPPQGPPALLSTASSVCDDGSPVKKKPRPSVDGGERPVGGVNGGGSAHQADEPVTLPRNSSDERLTQSAWQRDVRGLSTPPPLSGAQGEQLARELAESERQLLSSRVALDLAQARYEEASRTHHAKRDEVIAAAAAQQNQRAIAEAAATASQVQQHNHQHHQHQGTLEKRSSSLHSLARSCEAAAETEASPSGSNADGSSGSEDGRSGATVARRRHRHSPSPTHGRSYPPSNRNGGRGSRSLSASSSPEMVTVPSPSRRKLSSGSSKAASSALGPDCADEMREVKLEAALLCGIGRAPVARRSAVSSSLGSAGDPANATASVRHHNPSRSSAIAQVPGSPSASGDTDSDHSSLGGGGGGGGGGEDGSSKQRQQRQQQQQQQPRPQQQQRSSLMGGSSRGASFGEPPTSGSAERDAAWGGYAHTGMDGGGGGGGGDGRRAAPRAGDVLV